MNVVNLIGRLTRDPELRYTTTGKAVCNFNLAVNRPFGDKEADFFNVVSWNKIGENVANHLTKGRLVGVVGRLQSRSYEDDTGQRRFVIEVVANEVQFLDWGKENNNMQQNKIQQNNMQQNNMQQNNINNMSNGFNNSGFDLSEFEMLEDDEIVPF